MPTLLFLAAPVVAQAQVTITGVSPDVSWDNVSEYAATITGDNLLLGSTVTLSKAGAADIVGTILDASPPTSLTVTFDLTGAPFGLWHVNVSHPVVGTGSLPQAVNVRRSPDYDVLSAWGGPVQATQVVGNLAYVARGSGLVILDVSDPASMVELASIDLGANVYDVAVQGNYAFVGARAPALLSVVDVSVPSEPTLVVTGLGPGRGGSPTDVTIGGNTAYLIMDARNRHGDAYMLDISDPASLDPAAPGYERFPVEFVYAQAVSGNYLYSVAEERGGGSVQLWVSDISFDPMAPTTVGMASLTLDTIRGVTAMAVDGGFAYMTAWVYDPVSERNVGGLLVMDVSDPTNPWLTGMFTGLLRATDVVVANGVAYVADAEWSADPTRQTAEGLAVIDVSNPFLPTFTTGFTAAHGAPTTNVTLAGTTAFLGNDGEGLIAVDVSDSTNPTRLGNWHSPAYVQDITKEGNLLYFTDFWNGVTVLDVTDPRSPVLVNAYPAGTDNGDLRVRNGIAYVAAGTNGLEVVDFTDPANPILLARYAANGRAQSIALQGDVLMVGFDGGENLLFDLAVPADPLLASTIPGFADAWAITEGLIAISVREFGGGGVVYDVSDPYAPVQLPFSNELGGVDIAVEGSRAFTVDGEFSGGDVKFLDIAPDGTITRAARIPSPGPMRVAAQNGLVYVLFGSSLQLFDGLNLGRFDVPHRIASESTAGALSVHADWPYVYLGGIDRPDVGEGPSLTILGRADEPTVHLTFTSNVSGVTIAGDELEPIHAPDGLSVAVGDTFTGLTARHRRSRTDPPQRFDSWQRVEGYDEDGTPSWVELSRRTSLDLTLAEDLRVRNPVTGELEIAIQAHFVPAARAKGKDARSRRSGR